MFKSTVWITLSSTENSIAFTSKSVASLLYRPRFTSKASSLIGNAAVVETAEIPTASTLPIQTGAVTAVFLSGCVTRI